MAEGADLTQETHDVADHEIVRSEEEGTPVDDGSMERDSDGDPDNQ